MIINALNSGANVFMADFEDSNSPTWENNIEGQINLRDAVSRDHRLHEPGGQAVQLAERTIADAAGPPARLASGGEAPVSSTASRSPARCSISACSSSTTPRSCSSQGQRAVLLSAEDGEPSRSAAVERRVQFRAGRLSAPARHDPRHGADRNHPRRVRDGRDPLRAARPLGRAELRALGLHFQLHQEIPPPAGLRAARPRAGHDGPALPRRLRASS